jgi:hypothetical protein
MAPGLILEFPSVRSAALRTDLQIEVRPRSGTGTVCTRSNWVTESTAKPSTSHSIDPTSHKPADFNLNNTAVPPKVSRSYTSVIQLNYNNPSPSNDSAATGGSSHVWEGTLWDATGMTNGGSRGPYAEAHAVDDATAARERMVLRLQYLARATGYSHRAVTRASFCPL